MEDNPYSVSDFSRLFCHFRESQAEAATIWESSWRCNTGGKMLSLNPVNHGSSP